MCSARPSSYLRVTGFPLCESDPQGQVRKCFKSAIWLMAAGNAGYNQLLNVGRSLYDLQ